MMAKSDSKIKGMLYGLAAGDKNKGPFKMCLCLLKGIVAGNGKYNPSQSMQQYLQWYSARDTGFHDTGPVARNVFKLFMEKHPNWKEPDILNLSLDDLLMVSQTVDEYRQGMTAGVNACHRCAPLALLSFNENRSAVANYGKTESKLTHYSEISQNVCQAYLLLLIELLHTESCKFRDCVLVAADNISDKQTKDVLISGLNCDEKDLGTGGFSPEVLKSAIYFVEHGKNFTDTLETSLRFAGGANYCPVLVGALAGALYGTDDIPSDHLSHWKGKEYAEIDPLVEVLFQNFEVK